jgi:fructokinase
LETLKPVFDLEEMDTDQACRYFMEKFSLKMLVLTAGDKFSSIYYGNEKSTIQTPKVEVVDAVGAGDAFSGSLIGSLLTGKDIKEAHKEAVETAAYVCTQAGAWTPAR